jgi:hypothetical protein
MDDIPLTLMVSGSPVWMKYSLDGSGNVTLSGNTTFDVWSEGPHHIEVYANYGSGMEYDHVYFTVLETYKVQFVSPQDRTYSNSWMAVSLSIDINADWCGLSVDSGSNVTMSEASSSSWTYNITGLSEGEHDLDVWCNDSSGSWIINSTSFRVMLTAFNIDLKVPENRTYWGITSLDVIADTIRDASSCWFYLESTGPYVMSNYSSRSWFYNLSSISAGSFSVRIECDDTSGFSNSTSRVFTVKSAECESNITGTCTGSQQCVSGSCENIVCAGCSYASNHMCVLYECCSDQSCLDTQQCANNECTQITCECGEIQNHTCIEYECCSNFDCDTGQQCDLSIHMCILSSITIRAPDVVTAGSTFEIRIVNQDGLPIEGARVTIVFASGYNETLVTGAEGTISTVARESGSLRITAEAAGYERKTVTKEVSAGFDWMLVVALLIIMAVVGGGIFYFRQLPPIQLKKIINGQNITLKVKNRENEQMNNVLIMDTVPSGAFLSCSVSPRVETFGREDHITWFAALNPGEEIAINYQAMQTPDTFSVRIGEDEYISGVGVTDIILELLEKVKSILPVGKKEETPEKSKQEII